MSLGKTIRLYLADGSSTGPIVAEIINWTGQMIVVPRSQLSELAKREALQRTGVYLLVGPDMNGYQDRVYIGEGDEVFARLKSHDKDESKDFWTRAITVTSKDNNLTKAHGRYLESRLVELAHSARRTIVTNGNLPAAKSLPEPDEADMEYFLEQIQLILPVLGVDVLRPLVTRDSRQSDDSNPTLYLREVGVVAKAKEIDGIFVVLAGSTARRAKSASFDSGVDHRDSLINEGKLVIKDEQLYEFAEDVEFSSPSAAASVVVAANRSGRRSWQLADGRTYGEWKESQIEAAER